MRFFSGWKSWIKSLLLALIIVWALTTLLLAPKVVSRSSMEPNLFPGDLVLVSMWTLGPRAPVSIGIPFTSVKINRPTLPVWRLPGFGSLRTGDVVIFNYPSDSGVVDRKRIHVKRCIGLPGDTIQIRATDIFRNAIFQPNVQPVLYNYEVRGSAQEFGLLCEKIDPDELRSRHTHDDVHIVNMTRNEADSMQKEFSDLQIYPAIFNTGQYSGYLFPEAYSNHWTPDDYGPLYIPKSGDSIELNGKNLRVYDQLLRDFEHAEITNRGDSLFVDGQFKTHYLFKSNYYFLMGDNRHNSTDSRHWGMVPENHLIGKVSVVLFSYNPQAPWYRKIRWSQIFRSPS